MSWSFRGHLIFPLALNSSQIYSFDLIVSLFILRSIYIFFIKSLERTRYPSIQAFLSPAPRLVPTKASFSTQASKVGTGSAIAGVRGVWDNGN